MKKRIIFLLIIGIIGISLLLISCQKGDTGPQGAAGPSGGDGEDSMLMIMFQDGQYPDTNYSGTQDSEIIYPATSTNYGRCDRIFAGYVSGANQFYRFLISFKNLESYLPGDITVEKAYLKFYINNAYSTGITTLTAYAVEKDWTEGLGDCSGDTINGGATWDNYKSGSPWDNPGGDFDVNAPVSDTKIINSTDESVTFELDSNMVENWIKNPSANYGIVVKDYDESSGGLTHYTTFVSSNTSTASKMAPQLIIYYRIK